MIGQLTGKVVSVGSNFIIIDVGGIGYKVSIREEDLKKISKREELTILTHLIVRENILDLYGFFDSETLTFFQLLISISGVGPKSALSILSLASAQVLEKAIATNNTSYLTKVSGIGKKSAEKIILELKDKLEGVYGSTEGILPEDADAILALQALGYAQKDARDALKQVSDEVTGTQERIKEALKILGS
tara:strand:- start:5130 stop:5699 length:570 start_codon:yes stop_codon:yes gene_type:complete